ncbi:phosphoenolpyruvate--protein phosphotransferase [Aureibacillus halotolerans]|uniref:Phosphoenolpyruvate-protein phosphotransferase n=1 Tax=Aureibacillus halotolerans TaxID=1508390 RepID=A0A4R6TXM2_9BACI|nr:phosphoenolpyruvate--protein phosphotransferase [Aureibacillus halotolerans]TDQ36759.1 phosphoenolpyruvate--protein phosphotransferase [Aureibacillus halotolerans]
MSKVVKGIAASNGIAIAKAFILEEPNLTIEKTTVSNTEEENDRFSKALDVAKGELEGIREHAKVTLGEEEAEIFSAHLLVLSDPEFVDQVKAVVTSEKINAEAALDQVSSTFVTMFESMDNAYMKERAADIKDVTKRVMSHLLGVDISDPSAIDEEVIVIAHDLTPSDTAQLNKQFVQGFATNIGGRTSHSSIMARSLEIPAVVGTSTITEEISNGTWLIVDGLSGNIHINPSDETVEEFKTKQSRYEEKKAEWAKLKNEPSVTADGVHVELAANIGTPDDIEGALANGAEGVGLFRTEFLYMGRTELPTEDEQFESYKKVLEGMGDKPVVIRTLDIGGDKELPYLELPKEMNPFLGYRAIRLCLDQTDIFRTQLRALLRASVYGNLKIMFPMIATLEEFRQAKALLEEEKEQLQNEGVDVSDSFEVGIMVEIPSTAVIADQFAKEVDFFSIGTNDLIQYTLAADRMNEQVAYLYQPYHPAVLRLISNVIDAAHKEGKWAGMCGEMAGDEVALPILLGLGLDEFSMSATSILPARSQLLETKKADVEAVKAEILGHATSKDIEAYVRNAFPMQ